MLADAAVAPDPAVVRGADALAALDAAGTDAPAWYDSAAVSFRTLLWLSRKKVTGACSLSKVYGPVNRCQTTASWGSFCSSPLPMVGTCSALSAPGGARSLHFTTVSDAAFVHVVFLCMLAYYVEWHMRQALVPMLFHDHYHDPDAAEASVHRRRPRPALGRLPLGRCGPCGSRPAGSPG